MTPRPPQRKTKRGPEAGDGIDDIGQACAFKLGSLFERLLAQQTQKNWTVWTVTVGRQKEEGNLAGQIRSRDGKMQRRSHDQSLTGTLQTEFRLSNSSGILIFL